MSTGNATRVRLRAEGGAGFAVVTLDDADRRNALSLEMSAELVAIFDRLESTRDMRAVVVTGAPPAFCAGADLAQLRNADEQTLRKIYTGFVRVAQSPLFTIAAVNGAAVGAGINLALACDVRLAGQAARFDTRFLALGLHPGGGHTYLLQRCLSQSAATALLLGGGRVDGQEAERLGLAYRCVPDDDLLAAAEELVREAGNAPRELVERCKASIAFASSADLKSTIERELVEQLWSISQPEFDERVSELQRRIRR